MVQKKAQWTLEGGLEPPTLWLTATRSNQLSYSSLFINNYNKYYHKYIDIAVTSQSSVASELNKKNSSKKNKHEFVKKR